MEIVIAWVVGVLTGAVGARVWLKLYRKVPAIDPDLATAVAANAAMNACAHSSCKSIRDPRCRGLNCTRCCQSSIGCNGVCITSNSDDDEPEDDEPYMTAYHEGTSASRAGPYLVGGQGASETRRTRLEAGAADLLDELNEERAAIQGELDAMGGPTNTATPRRTRWERLIDDNEDGPV